MHAVNLPAELLRQIQAQRGRPGLFGSTHYKRIELVAVEIAKVPGVEAFTRHSRSWGSAPLLPAMVLSEKRAARRSLRTDCVVAPTLSWQAFSAAPSRAGWR